MTNMKRIIIADDSSTARIIIRRCLEIAGCHESEFVEASNGQEVIDNLKKQTVDLVVTDLNMPVMDGTELLRRMKSSPRMHEIPVVVITSAANPKKIEDLKNLNAYSVLNKPISPAAISATIEGLKESSEDN